MKRKELKLLDSLDRKFKTDNSSIWQGSSGSVYVFKHLNESLDAKRAPIVQVYKDRKYLTGLFRTKDRDKFSGDIKMPDGKKYLIFQIAGKEKIKVFQRV